MYIYLAAPWADRDMMSDLASKFEAAGHDITWKWWDTPELGPQAEGGDQDEQLREQAYNDFNGVTSAAALVLFNTKKSEGKAVEQGIALAMDIPIIAVGKRGDGTSKNVFHYLDDYTWVDDVDAALSVLNEWEENGYVKGEDSSWGV